jgi:Zn-dependent protease with chaperone function
MRGRTLTTLTILSATLAVGELISAVSIAVENYHDAQPAFAVVFAVLFAIGWWLLRRRHITGGVVLLAVLCLFEVVSYPSWQRHNAYDWISQTVYAAIALAGLGTAVVLFVSRRRSAPATA